MKTRKVLCVSVALCLGMQIGVSMLGQQRAEVSAADTAVNTKFVSDQSNIYSGAIYQVESVLSGKLLSVTEENNVYQWESKKDSTQQWAICANSDGYCNIVSVKNPSMALTVENGDGTDGANIYIASKDNSVSQQFKIQKDGNAYYITTRSSDDKSSLDVYDISTENGANICQWNYWGGDGQKFKITPVNNTYTFIRGDLTYDGVLSALDFALMKRGIPSKFDAISAGVADLSNDGAVDNTDAKLLQSYLLGKATKFAETYYSYTPPAPPAPDGRLFEYLDRGVVAVRSGNNVFVSWRSLADDDPNTAFNLYRVTDGKEVKVNGSPLTGGTNFTDTTADLTKANKYYVKTVLNGKEEVADGSYTMPANKGSGSYITVPIREGGSIHFVWVGDFNGDGAYDYLLDREGDEHQKLEAYLNDGTYLWTIDMGYNSENKNNISPGPSTIDVGMWDGCTVYDMDSDGYADVCLRIADGVKFGDGKVYENKTHPNAQAIAVIDGRNGALKATAPVPSDYINVGPLACMMEIGYLDGINPSVCCWMKNRNPNKSFNSLNVAYSFVNGEFKQLWKTGSYGAEAHQIRIADVNYDGKDEFVHQGYCINGDGSLRYKVDGIVHGDRWFIGSFENANNGKEMMGYGIQQGAPDYLLEYYYNASTGKMVWGHYEENGSGYIDMARGNIGDLDPNYEGLEMFSFEGISSIDNKLVSSDKPYPCYRLFWDGDLLSESYNEGKIEKWNYQNKWVDRLATTWKIYGASGSARGVGMFHGDILGDWREESILTNYDSNELVIYTTDIPTEHRIYTLAQNPCYRNCMTAKGYYQSNMLDYFLGHDMEQPPRPAISVIKK